MENDGWFGPEVDPKQKDAVIAYVFDPKQDEHCVLMSGIYYLMRVGGFEAGLIPAITLQGSYIVRWENVLCWKLADKIPERFNPRRFDIED